MLYLHGMASHYHVTVMLAAMQVSFSSSFLHLRIGKVPRSVAVRQPLALLDKDLQATCDFVVAEGEDDVSAHLHAVKVPRFTVNAHKAAHRALQKCENTPNTSPVRTKICNNCEGSALALKENWLKVSRRHVRLSKLAKISPREGFGTYRNIC